MDGSPRVERACPLVLARECAATCALSTDSEGGNPELAGTTGRVSFDDVSRFCSLWPSSLSGKREAKAADVNDRSRLIMAPSCARGVSETTSFGPLAVDGFSDVNAGCFSFLRLCGDEPEASAPRDVDVRTRVRIFGLVRSVLGTTVDVIWLSRVARKAMSSMKREKRKNEKLTPHRCQKTHLV